MDKDCVHDREIEELKIRIKRLEEKELRFRRRNKDMRKTFGEEKNKGKKDLIFMVVFLSFMASCKMKNSLIG